MLVVIVTIYVMPLKLDPVQKGCEFVFIYQQSSSRIMFMQEQNSARISKHGHVEQASNLQRYQAVKLVIQHI